MTRHSRTMLVWSLTMKEYVCAAPVLNIQNCELFSIFVLTINRTAMAVWTKKMLLFILFTCISVEQSSTSAFVVVTAAMICVVPLTRRLWRISRTDFGAVIKQTGSIPWYYSKWRGTQCWVFFLYFPTLTLTLTAETIDVNHTLWDSLFHYWALKDFLTELFNYDKKSRSVLLNPIYHCFSLEVFFSQQWLSSLPRYWLTWSCSRQRFFVTAPGEREILTDRIHIIQD